jgi:hypothetical protein
LHLRKVGADIGKCTVAISQINLSENVLIVHRYQVQLAIAIEVGNRTHGTDRTGHSGHHRECAIAVSQCHPGERSYQVRLAIIVDIGDKLRIEVA